MPHQALRDRRKHRQAVFHGTQRGSKALESLARQLGTEIEAEPDTFSLAFDALALGSMVLTRWRHGPVWWTGSLRQAGADLSGVGGGTTRGPFVRLFVVLDGSLRLGQGNAGDVVEAGGAAFLRGDEKFTYEADTEVTVVVCDISADDPLTAPVSALAPQFSTLRTREVLVSAFTSFVEDLLQHEEDDFTPATKSHLVRALVPLIGSVFALPIHRRPVELSQAVRRAQVVHYIESHFQDVSLSTGSIATRFGMSERSLQRLFEGEQLSVNQLIQARRADRAVLLLRDPRYDSYPIHQLAQLTGHGNAIAFRRAVLGTTGLTPTALRVWDRSARPGSVRLEQHVG